MIWSQYPGVRPLDQICRPANVQLFHFPSNSGTPDQRPHRTSAPRMAIWPTHYHDTNKNMFSLFHSWCIDYDLQFYLLLQNTNIQCKITIFSCAGNQKCTSLISEKVLLSTNTRRCSKGNHWRFWPHFALEARIHWQYF